MHSIEYGWFIDEECIDRMVQQSTWWVPTLALVPHLSKMGKRPNLGKTTAWSRRAKRPEIFRKMKEEQIPIWREAVRRGVKIAMGTDQSHRLLVGENLVELRFMVEYWMRPMERSSQPLQRRHYVLGCQISAN